MPAPKAHADHTPKVVAECHGIEVLQTPYIFQPWLIRKINNGRYEKPEIAGALAVVRPGDKVLELGAGLGIVGASVAANCQPAAIRAYEANPDLLPHIEALYAHNGLSDRLDLRNAILLSDANAPQSLPFHISDRFSFSSIQTPEKKYARSVDIPTAAWAEVRDEFAPNVLLMDIEGGEADFLAHADLSGLRAVVVEFHPGLYGKEGMRRCKQYLRAAGFQPIPEISQRTVWAAERTDG